ncbi:hypothetical protein E1B28_007150 [Marasmius oreades]|uniref:Uncharacterized protein n=1 Tax=Marasmius oreades TaxID=181124 RepID=A0A9P7S113_9AGAR|nr:uncharacterized protein E1B28_007150 [Marasmius oreades]KAG7093474.1 hypothetical protein E1B28_007150 [Marasmius oreades]
MSLLPTITSFLPQFLSPTTAQGNDEMSNPVIRSDRKPLAERGDDERSDPTSSYSQRMGRTEKEASCACEKAHREGAEIDDLARTTRLEDNTAGTTIYCRNDTSHSVNSEYRYQGMKNPAHRSLIEGKSVGVHDRENPRQGDLKAIGFPSQISSGEQSKETVQQHQHRSKENHETTKRTPNSTAGQIEKVPTREIVEKLKEKNKHLKDRLENYEIETEKLNNKLNANERENGHLRMQLEAKEGQHAADRQLLEQRTRELQCSQTYLSAVRSYSGRELIDLVEELNTEVLQAAAYITDAVDLTLCNDKGHFTEGQDFLARAKMMVGDEVVNILLKSNRSSDAFRTIVQNTLQTVILRDLQYMLNSWSINPDTSGVFEETYKSIRKNVERQSIAGRWKALTKAQSKYASYAAMDQITGNHIFNSILSILFVATGRLNKKDFNRRLSDIIREILTRAAQLDKVLGEIIDEDWEVFYILPGERFDQDCMVDTYAAPTTTTRRRSGSELQTAPTATIFCSTDLGLLKRASGTERRQAMLKAKVLLQATVMEGLDESGSNIQLR